MENNVALTAVIRSLEILVENNTGQSNAPQFELLVNFIDHLVKSDFNRLLSILYRVDISEEKLKKRLAGNKDKKIESAVLIAELIVEREQQKIESRAKYSKK